MFLANTKKKQRAFLQKCPTQKLFHTHITQHSHNLNRMLKMFLEHKFLLKVNFESRFLLVFSPLFLLDVI